MRRRLRPGACGSRTRSAVDSQRKPTRSNAAIYVLGINRHPCDRNRPETIGSVHWTISATGSSTKPATVDMRLTCTHAYHMSKMVQIRNVPEALHRKLKVRAADAGQTLSDYLLAELERLAARPTRDEMLTRLHGRKRVTLKTPAAVVVREERESA